MFGELSTVTPGAYRIRGVSLLFIGCCLKVEGVVVFQGTPLWLDTIQVSHLFENNANRPFFSDFLHHEESDIMNASVVGCLSGVSRV